MENFVFCAVSDDNFYKNTNVQPVQINGTAKKRFQNQGRNNLTVKDNTYEYITMNQTQNEGYRLKKYSNIGM